MIKKLLYVMRGLFVRLKNHGRVILPLHSRLDKRTTIRTSNGNIQFGYGFVSSSNSFFAALDNGQMIIGERVVVNRNCIFVCRDGINIGDHCTFGPNVCIYDHDHKYGREGVKAGYKYGKVVIGKHCWIGAGVIILRGAHIGDGCVIGAGCVIKGEIPSHSLVTMNRELTIREIQDG